MISIEYRGDMKVLKSLYLSVLLTFTEVAESTEACNKEKYRHSLTSLSMFVQLLEPRWEETGTEQQWCAPGESGRQRDEVYSTNLTVESRLLLAVWNSRISQRNHHRHCWTFHFTSLLCWTQCTNHHYTSDVVSFANQSHKKWPCLQCSEPPLSSTPHILTLAASVAAPLRENPAMEPHSHLLSKTTNCRLDGPCSLLFCHEVSITLSNWSLFYKCHTNYYLSFAKWNVKDCIKNILENQQQMCVCATKTGQAKSSLHVQWEAETEVVCQSQFSPINNLINCIICAASAWQKTLGRPWKEAQSVIQLLLLSPEYSSEERLE